MLTVGRLLTTNVSQINLGLFLFRATLKVRLGWCLSLHLKWTTWTAPNTIHISQLVNTTTVDHSCEQECSINDKLCILVKAQPNTQSDCHGHQLGLGYSHETWAYPANTVLANATFLLLLDTNLLSKQALLTTHSYMTLQHSAKLLACEYVDLSIS